MNKIRKSAVIALKKWFSKDDWNEIHNSDCNFCDDANLRYTEENSGYESSCEYCLAPGVLCGKRYKSLYKISMNLYEVTDEFKPMKSIRIMRIGLLFLLLLGKLPKCFINYVEKYIVKLNKQYSEIDY